MTNTVARVNGQTVGGIIPILLESEGTPPHWGAYLTVGNVDETIRNAKALGANIIVPPSDSPGVGRFSVLQDPQGAVLSIITYAGSSECQ
jgi:hypothetical protein